MWLFKLFTKKRKMLKAEPEIRGIEDLKAIAEAYVEENGLECLDDLDTPTFIRYIYSEKLQINVLKAS